MDVLVQDAPAVVKGTWQRFNPGVAGETFGERQAELRKARGLSQVKLSYALLEADAEERRGYDPSFVARVERGDRSPPPRYLLLLRRVLDPAPGEFPELDLADARRQLDEREVGLDAALLTLRQLEAAAAGELMPRPAKGGLIEQLRRAHRPTSAAQRREPKPKAGAKTKRSSPKRAA